jgi:hypothetical protein
VPTRHTALIALAAATLAVVAAALILLNLTLLGYAQPRNDPVGKLSPRATELRPSQSSRIPPTSPTTEREADD